MGGSAGASARGVWARRSSLLACVVLAAALLAVPAGAAPGDLDSTFGTGGEVTTDFGGTDVGRGLAIQADGRIVVAGGAESDFALARYKPDGSLDSTFGTGGKVTTSFGNVNLDQANAVTIQADGKIVAAGSVGGFLGFALARYNADGSLDTSFDGDGTVTTLPFDQAFAVATQADGKILAAGSAGVCCFALARYNTDGSLDTSFDGDGKVTTDFGLFSQAFAMAVQSDGKIVVAGAGGDDFGIARYNTDGSLDTSFDGDGKVTTDFGGVSVCAIDRASGIAIQPDGRIVAAGVAGFRSFCSAYALARYNTDGSLDTSFDGDGKVTTDFGQDSGASAVAIQANGKPVVAGSAFPGGFCCAFGVARYNSDGSLDSTFGTGGKVTTNFGQAFANAIQTDGKIVVAGGNGADFALARYEGDPSATEISIDIKPGSSANPIKLSGGGLIPVAILTTDSFDATTVDPGTVCFGDDDIPGQRDCSEAHGRGHIQDVNGDGRSDLLLHYEVGETGIDPGDRTACLTGRTFAGLNVEGCDSIRTL